MVPDRIKNLRLGQGLTHEGLAFKAGMSVATVQRTEAGKHEPSTATLRKLADALGVPLADLLEPEAAALRGGDAA